jgi:hypothetical protein
MAQDQSIHSKHLLVYAAHRRSKSIKFGAIKPIYKTITPPDINPDGADPNFIFSKDCFLCLLF